MMHGSSDINSNRQIFFFVILGQFSLFYHHNSPKDKNIKQMKQKHLEIWSFSTSVPKMIIIGYTVPDIWHVTDVIVIFHFGLLFALLLPQQPKKWNCIWRYYHFTQVYQKSSLYAILFLRYGVWQIKLLFFIIFWLP